MCTICIAYAMIVSYLFEWMKPKRTRIHVIFFLSPNFTFIRPRVVLAECMLPGKTFSIMDLCGWQLFRLHIEAYGRPYACRVGIAPTKPYFIVINFLLHFNCAYFPEMIMCVRRLHVFCGCTKLINYETINAKYKWPNGIWYFVFRMHISPTYPFIHKMRRKWHIDYMING